MPVRLLWLLHRQDVFLSSCHAQIEILHVSLLFNKFTKLLDDCFQLDDIFLLGHISLESALLIERVDYDRLHSETRGSAFGFRPVFVGPSAAILSSETVIAVLFRISIDDELSIF